MNRASVILGNTPRNAWTGAGVTCRFEKLAKKVGKPYRQYDFRYTWMTNKLIDCVDSHIVAKLAGHSDESMTHNVYPHVAEDHKFMLKQADVGGWPRAAFGRLVSRAAALSSQSLRMRPTSSSVRKATWNRSLLARTLPPPRGRRPCARTEVTYTGAGRSRLWPWGWFMVRAANPEGARQRCTEMGSRTG